MSVRPPENEAQARTRSSRREPMLALGGLALGAGAVVFASTRGWMSAPGGDAAGPLDGISGAEVAPAARALALVGLTGVVAVLATRGAARRLTGIAVALSGLGASVSTALARTGPDVPTAPSDTFVGPGPWWALSLLGGVLVTFAGVWIVRRGGTWPVMGARYEAPGSAAAARRFSGSEGSEGSERGDSWQALDRGEDPSEE